MKRVLLLLLLAACARKVTLSPDEARQKNDADWTIKSEPRPDAGR